MRDIFIGAGICMCPTGGILVAQGQADAGWLIFMGLVCLAIAVIAHYSPNKG